MKQKNTPPASRRKKNSPTLAPEEISLLTRQRFLTTAEFAAITRSSPKLIRRLLRIGTIKPILGIRPYRIPAAQLLKLEGGAA